MDTEKTKQIVISYHAIQNAIDAMLKPIRVELSDSETVAKMPRGTYDTLEWLKSDCETIQRVLARMDYISALEKDLDADEEITAAGEMITDILWDVQPAPMVDATDGRTLMDFYSMTKTAKIARL